jgi:hypothetical protein
MAAYGDEVAASYFLKTYRRTRHWKEMTGHPHVAEAFFPVTARYPINRRPFSKRHKTLAPSVIRTQYRRARNLFTTPNRLFQFKRSTL